MNTVQTLCISLFARILERLISENFLLRSTVSHAHVTQRVSSHSDERTSSFTELCTFVASSPGHSQILSRMRSQGEKLKLRHGPEMVDSVST